MLCPAATRMGGRACKCCAVQKIVMAVVAVILSSAACAASGSVFTECGGVLQEPRGVVQSPNFPAPFPTPLSCRWVIQAPADKKIVLYFTQYFLRGALRLFEYDYYQSDYLYAGLNALGEMNFEEDIRYVVAYRPYVVLELRLHNVTNIHLRVEDYLEDVHGFNITYEIINRTEQVRSATCSVMNCSFLGHCLADAEFSRYQCTCFTGYYGKECQYGPYCDPDKGINMCFNNGRCRYIYGSTVNVCECPDGHTGPKCEEKREEPQDNTECAQTDCSNHCEETVDGLRCACKEGFRLNVGRTTCVEDELYRVSVDVVVQHPTDQWNTVAIQKRIMTFLWSSEVEAVKRLDVDGFNSMGELDGLQFHFFVDKNDLELVATVVDDLVYNITGTTANRTIGVHPEMKLLTIENHDRVPALEGRMLTLICTARGSPALHFRWYKDGQLFNASLTSRNAWEIRLFDDINEKQVSVFNIDGVTTYDKGDFVCEIEDYGQTEQKSLRVHVMPLPQVEVEPLTVSLVAGQAHSFRCFSPDDNMRTFTYQWLRNELTIGELLNGEVVEDLLPSGSRLSLSHARVSANYTCRVLNRAGLTAKSVFLFVIAPNESLTACESGLHEGVRWNRTFGGFYDLQPCPVDPPETAAWARRDCACRDGGCAWGQPNYARCQSLHIVSISQQLEQIQLGYQLGRLSTIYTNMYDVVHKAQNRTLAGDVELFARNLLTLLTVTLQFPALGPEPDKSDFNLKTLAQFMDILLAEVQDTHQCERKDMTVGARLIQACEILVQLSCRSTDLISLHNITFPRLEIILRNVTLQSVNSSVAGSALQMSPVATRILRHLPSVIPQDVPEQPHGDAADKGVIREVLQVTFSPSIVPVMPVHSRPRRGRSVSKDLSTEVFVTPVISAIPLDCSGDADNSNADDVNNWIKLDLVHQHKAATFGANSTKCVAWIPENRERLVGYWSFDSCHVINRTVNVTTCLCPRHGHYAVTATIAEPQVHADLPESRNNVLMVSCVLSLCGLGACMAIYAITWRHIAGTTSVIHLSLVMSVAGVSFVSIFCLSETTQQRACAAGKVLLQFFQLTAFSFLLVEAVYVFLKIRSVQGAASRRSTCIKYFLLGWGVPSVTTLAVILMSEVFGYDHTCLTWCWGSESHWHFYGFLVPLLVLSTGHAGVTVLCLICTRTWKDDFPFQNKKTCIFTAVRAFSIATQLIILCISGMLNESPNITESRRFLFLSVNCTLTATIIVTMFVMRHRVRRAVILVCCKKKSTHAKTTSSRSCRVSMSLEQESEETKVGNIQEFYRETDRNKFTAEHKQHLRFLLGTSSSASGSLSLEGDSVSVCGRGQVLPAGPVLPQAAAVGRPPPAASAGPVARLRIARDAGATSQGEKTGFCSHCLLRVPLCRDVTLDREGQETVNSDLWPLEWSVTFYRNPYPSIVLGTRRVQNGDLTDPSEGAPELQTMLRDVGPWRNPRASSSGNCGHAPVDGGAPSAAKRGGDVTEESDALLAKPD